MVKKKVVIAVILMALVPALMLAQADSIYRPMSISFVPGFSTNGFPGTNVTTNFSFNILGGLNARVVGLEIGSILNINAKSMRGLQIGGVFNFTGQEVRGIQIGGVATVVGGDFRGLQLSGVANFVGSDVRGGQVAGVFNTAGGEFRGLQIAGVANLSLKDVQGAQIAGPVNISIGDAPFQLGVTNIELGKTCTQIGVLNVANESKGLQLGVVNFAVKQEGVPIGIVSVAADGWYKMCVWTDGNAIANVALKMGSKYIYNIYAYGYNPFSEDEAINKFGLGLGTHLELPGPLFVDIDAVHYNVVTGILPFVEQSQGYAGLTEVRASGGFQLLPGLAIIAGPTLSIWHSTWLNGDFVRWAGLNLADLDEANYTDIWLGFSVGVQLF